MTSIYQKQLHGTGLEQDRYGEATVCMLFPSPFYTSRQVLCELRRTAYCTLPRIHTVLEWADWNHDLQGRSMGHKGSVLCAY
jgi:hypothetical protein